MEPIQTYLLPKSVFETFLDNTLLSKEISDALLSVVVIDIIVLSPPVTVRILHVHPNGPNPLNLLRFVYSVKTQSFNSISK